MLQVNSKGYKVYGAGSSLYGGTITINSRKVTFKVQWHKGSWVDQRVRAQSIGRYTFVVLVFFHFAV